MKFCLAILQVLLSFASKSQELSGADSMITRSSLQFTIATLAHDSMQGRFTAMPETINAAAFIAQRFKDAGLKPLSGNNGFFYKYPLIFEKAGTRTQVEALNVLGAIQGTDNTDTLVIFCAHYDHIGVKRGIHFMQEDTVYNGANDNASGVALLVELAKYYAALQRNRYKLLFMAFSGEEQGLLGSANVASNMDQSRIRAVINFDMVGRSLNNRSKTCMVVAQDAKPIIKSLNAALVAEKPFFIYDKYPEEKLFSRSDHFSFNQVKNRIFFTATSPTDQYYHTVDDEFETIDFDFLFTASKNIATACRIFIE